MQVMDYVLLSKNNDEDKGHKKQEQVEVMLETSEIERGTFGMEVEYLSNTRPCLSHRLQ